MYLGHKMMDARTSTLGRLTLVLLQVDETPGIALPKQLVDVTCSTWKEGWNVGLRRGRALVRGGGVIRPFGAIGVALEGVRGGLQRFYSGLSFSVVNQIPSNVIYLVTYQKAKELVEVNLPWLGKTEEGSPWPPLIASVVTEVGPAHKVESPTPPLCRISRGRDASPPNPKPQTLNPKP
jgi:hypothetical protein